jgi:hypothetical protein
MADSTAIAAFTTAINAFFTTQQTAITDIVTEFATLNSQIATLQNSAGQITPADQATLDTIQATAAGITSKLTAMDTLAPPPTPPVGP